MNNKKQKHIFLSFLIVIFAMGLFSCEKKQIQFGNQFEDNSYTQIYEVDTITPLVSTVFVDSFVTANSGTGMVGYTTDPEFGTLQSSAYFQLGIPPYSSTASAYKNVIFDSVTIFFKIRKGVWYGDTTKPLTLNVYRLTQNINVPLNGANFRNRDTVAAEANPMQSASFMIYPTRADSLFDTLQIRLPDTLGQSLLTRLQTADYSIQTVNQFLTYFKGIKITGDPSSNLSIGINDSIVMRVYYTTPGLPIPVESIAAFPMYNAATQFNNFALQRTGALAAAGINRTNNEIFSSQTGNTAYLLPAANAMIKVRFPSLATVAQLNYIQILKATLLIRPIPNSYTGIFGLPTSLQLIPTDLNNGYGSSPITASGSTSAQTGNLGTSYSPTNTTGPYYLYDVTSELQGLISNPAATQQQQYGLLLSPTPGMFTTYPRLIIGDSKNANAQMQLQIQYLSIQ